MWLLGHVSVTAKRRIQLLTVLVSVFDEPSKLLQTKAQQRRRCYVGTGHRRDAEKGKKGKKKEWEEGEEEKEDKSEKEERALKEEVDERGGVTQ